MANVKVGVAWRRDGRNVAHQGDLAVFQHPALAGMVDMYSLVWDGAEAPQTLRIGELKDMDLLVIPGGPHSNDTQIPVIGKEKLNAATENTVGYAGERAKSELDLIEQARTLGMPILALCGGSWRLVENYGGQTVELAALDDSGKFLNANSNEAARQRHAGNMNNVKTEFKHGVTIRPGSLVENAMGRTQHVFGKEKAGLRPLLSKKPLPMEANSVHWAAVRTGDMGTRGDVPAKNFHVAPNDMLNMSAKDDGPLKTSEAVESAHGAPVIGTQWHPEYQLSLTGSSRETAGQKASRASNLALMQWMIKAGKAYRAHREAMTLLLRTMGNARVEMPGLNNITFKGAPAHTGGAGVSNAKAIKPHALDADKPATLKEAAVRSYIFNLGRKPGSIFLTPVEYYNLAVFAPLSRFREPDELKKGPILGMMSKAKWTQKYCSGKDLNTIEGWPA